MSNIVTPQAPARPSAKEGPEAMVIPAAARRKPVSRDRLTAILMLMPSIILIAFFVYFFIAWNGWASLTSWRGLGAMNRVGPITFPAADFVGLRNYERLFGNTAFGGDTIGDQRFLHDLQNNIIFTVFFLVGCIFLGLLLAIFLDQHIKGETFFRNVFLFPMALSFVVTGTVWKWVFIDAKWLTNKELALPAVIIAAVWQMSGFAMAMFLAALRGIPDELREAARVDGSSEVGIYRHIIIPLINPIILSALIILGHISLKIFDLVYVMTGGSPALGYATDVPSTYLFQVTFKDDLFAKGASISAIMLVLVAVVIVPYLWVNMRSEAQS
jgi:glucose/mannose transport system permease protein